jgi:tRNA G37 N-methylase Trm5
VSRILSEKILRSTQQKLKSQNSQTPLEAHLVTENRGQRRKKKLFQKALIRLENAMKSVFRSFSSFTETEKKNFTDLLSAKGRGTTSVLANENRLNETYENCGYHSKKEYFFSSSRLFLFLSFYVNSIAV